ncbi:hypothetical protein BDN70DRAFT_843615 [Pholiota conissans]|uniref:Uncharacterized protein n=1 Tax=Pholiota conissans TaxID=109636 RepID=A0A9P6CUL8_9AGAR|nr:hypothetical protein BDN70DRAFT_843615 [Pholiota conissans]
MPMVHKATISQSPLPCIQYAFSVLHSTLSCFVVGLLPSTWIVLLWWMMPSHHSCNNHRLRCSWLLRSSNYRFC